MLWYKSWLETRSRFLIGLVVMLFSAGGTVLIYPELAKLLPTVPNDMNLSGALGRQVRESLEISSTYRGYVWMQWFASNGPKAWGLFAIMLGTGGLMAQASKGALFTLSLPVSRESLVGTRAVSALGELLVLAVVPSLAVAVLSPVVGQSYGLGEAFVHAMCMFIAGSVLFSLTFLLATVFNDIWRPPLIVGGIAMCISFAEHAVSGLSQYSLFGIMSAESYFRYGALPWIGLLVTAAASTGMLYLATMNMARRDF